VSPNDDTVAVIRPDNNTVITKISVGDEPESVALTPNGQYAYVANAAGGTVSVIQISDPAWGTFSASVVATLTTGAEPWNIVTSPDGNRVFVANSAQDTITVVNAANRTIIGHVDLRNSIANDPDRSRHFQPRGLAVTLDNTKLYVTRFLSFTKAGGKGTISARKDWSPCSTSTRPQRTSPTTTWRALSRWRRGSRASNSPA
jgi:YVTN family beta-propeller protein